MAILAAWELAELVRVSKSTIAGQFDIQFPSLRQCDDYAQQLGKRPPTDDVIAEYRALFWRQWPALKQQLLAIEAVRERSRQRIRIRQPTIRIRPRTIRERIPTHRD